MKKDELIAKELMSIDFIDFAVLFGSVAEERSTDISDIDLGIYSGRDISLTDIGLLTVRLEALLKKKIDIVILNDIYRIKPVLGYEIIKSGKLLLCRNQDSFIDFKKKVFLYYLDSRYLMEQVDKSLQARLKSGRFGERNYAGTV